MQVSSKLIAGLLCVGCSHSAPTHSTPRADARPPVAASADNVCGSPQVLFTTGSAELDDASKARLRTYAGCLERREIETIYVVGMTDPEGTAESNLELGRARAAAVAGYLRESGSTAAFDIRSYGEQGASTSEPLWPLERQATVAAQH